MGFWSAIGSCLSSIGSAIGGAIKAVGSALSSGLASAVGALGSIGVKALGLFTKVSALVMGPLGPILGPIVVQIVLTLAAKVIENLAKERNMMDEDDRVDEVGYRMEKANERKLDGPEKFYSFREYYEYLKSEIPVDERARTEIRNNRLRYITEGTAALSEGWAREINMEIPDDFLIIIGRCAINELEVKAIVAAYEALSKKEVSFGDYLTGKLSGVEEDAITNALLVSYKNIMPEKTDDDVYGRIAEMITLSKDDMKLADYHKDIIDDIEKQGKEGKTAKDIEIRI